jgi:hypothetical protein
MLYEKFMDGRRIAPRHIMVELDGSETYDVFYAWDTDSVFDRIKKGIADRTIQAEPIVRGDKSILERVKSRDVRDREAVEQAFTAGEPQLKDSMLKVAETMGGDAPVDLLRLGVLGLDVERANAARRALVSGGVSMEKMARVVGVSDSVLFDKENPTNPINRRISIIVMNKATEDAALGRNDDPADADAEAGEAPAEAAAETPPAG